MEVHTIAWRREHAEREVETNSTRCDRVGAMSIAEKAQDLGALSENRTVR